MAEDVEREEEASRVQVAAVIVDHHVGVRADPEVAEEARRLRLGGEPVAPGRHFDSHVVDAQIDGTGNVAPLIGLPLRRHVHDAQIAVAEVGFEPRRVDEKRSGERRTDREEQRACHYQEHGQTSVHHDHLTCQRISASVTCSVTDVFSRRTAMTMTSPTLC